MPMLRSFVRQVVAALVGEAAMPVIAGEERRQREQDQQQPVTWQMTNTGYWLPANPNAQPAPNTSWGGGVPQTVPGWEFDEDGNFRSVEYIDGDRNRIGNELQDRDREREWLLNQLPQEQRPEPEEPITLENVELPIEPIEPPANLWERVIESFSRFSTRMLNIPIPDGRTALQALLDRLTGRRANAASAPRTISEAVSPFGPRGLFGERDENDVNQMWGRDRGLFGRMFDSVRRSGVGRAMSGQMAGRMGAAMSGAALAVGALTVGAAVAVGALRRLADSAWKSVQGLTKYNGLLLAQQVNLEVGDILRNIAKAQELEAEGSRRFRAEDRWREAMHPWEVAMDRIGLDVGSWFLEKGADFLEGPASAWTDLTTGNIAELVGMGDNPLMIGMRAVAERIDDKLAQLLGIEKDKQVKDENKVGFDQLLMHNMLTDQIPDDVNRNLMGLAPEGAKAGELIGKFGNG